MMLKTTEARPVDTVFDAGAALVVGAGVAGLFAALKLAPRPVTVISPEPLGHGASSAWAQGGVAAAVGVGDAPALHAEDTVSAGAGLVDADMARLVTEEAAARIEDLAALGAPFDRDETGAFLLSREAAHGRARVVRVQGDGAGRAIMATLIEATRRAASIRVAEGLIAMDLLVEDGAVRGVVCRRVGDRYAAPLVLRAPATLLAAGGAGGLYAVTTNPARVRGQAVGMAARAGAPVADAEFVQFHPTAIDVGQDPAPLATEALRGEGAVLVNRAGARFMRDAHPDAELAPRDIVARAIFREIQAGRGALLDTRPALGAEIDARFPAVAASCRAAGVDPTQRPIPVAPAAHYHMGGVLTDGSGRTPLPGLWVAGEAASTGLHGANRLASNGLLEALVLGARAAADLAEFADLAERGRRADGGAARAWTIAPPAAGWNDEERLRRLAAVGDLRRIMSDHVGVERDAAGLRQALRLIAHLEAEAVGVTGAFLNMTSAASLIAAAALLRKESRGGHFRSDHPEPDPKLRARRAITLAEALNLRADAAETAA